MKPHLYQVTLNNVNGNTAYDGDGNFLMAIGNHKLHNGDAVFSDGRYIYGHQRINNGGLPVSGNEVIPISAWTWSSGYFDMNLKFTKYEDIGRFTKLVNGKKKIYSEYDYILDADVDEEGNEYYLTYGSFNKFPNKKHIIHNYYCYYDSADPRNQDYREPFCKKWAEDSASWEGSSSMPEGSNKVVTRTGGWKPLEEGKDVLEIGYDNTDSIENPQIIKVMPKGERTKIGEIDLNKYAQMVVEKFPQAVQNAMGKYAEYFPSGGRPWPDITPEPPEPFISDIEVNIDFGKVYPNGEWSAIISASVSGYCFPNYTRDSFEWIYNKTDRFWKTDWTRLIYDIWKYFYAHHKVTQNTNVNVFMGSMWVPVNVTYSSQMQVNSKGTVKILSSGFEGKDYTHYDYGTKYNAWKLSTVTLDVNADNDEERDALANCDWLYGAFYNVEDYYHCTWWNYRLDDCYYKGTKTYVCESDKHEIEIDLYKEEISGNGQTVKTIQQDGYYTVASFSNYSVHEIYTPKGKLITDKIEFSYLSNMSICKVNNGYLIGIHHGKLWHVDKKGNVNQLNDGLDNYRLRPMELQNMKLEVKKN